MQSWTPPARRTCGNPGKMWRAEWTPARRVGVRTRASLPTVEMNLAVQGQHAIFALTQSGPHKALVTCADAAACGRIVDSRGITEWT